MSKLQQWKVQNFDSKTFVSCRKQCCDWSILGYDFYAWNALCHKTYLFEVLCIVTVYASVLLCKWDSYVILYCNWLLFSLLKGMNLFYLFNNNIEIKHVFICLCFLHIKFVQVNDFVESGTRYLDTKIKFTIYNNISVVYLYFQ